MKKRRWAVGKTKDKREKDIQGALSTHNRMHDDEQTKRDITKTMDSTYLGLQSGNHALGGDDFIRVATSLGVLQIPLSLFQPVLLG